ncbi:MAG TPA: hypothetical protein VFS19_00445 [Planctomycetota bacterium]|nr:hypothetical protein [Planctomycetota bacterium]
MQETISALNGSGTMLDRVVPRRALSGQVTSVASELGLVVISIGRDAGVNEGDEFMIHRGETFLASITIERVDRAWSAGRVVLKGKEVPKIGDQASNNFLPVPGKTGGVAQLPAPPVRKVQTITGDEVAIEGIDPASVKKGAVLVLSRDWKYVSAVEVVDVIGATAKTRVLPRLRAQPIETGDLAVPVTSTRELWRVLPDSIRKDILSDRSLREAHLKLFFLRAKGGGR